MPEYPPPPTATTHSASSEPGAIEIRSGGLDDPPVRELLQTHLRQARAETARGSAHALDLQGLQAPDIDFWSVWRNGELLAIGALKRLPDDHFEIKSMHTTGASRRTGIASALLRHIIDAARRRGARRLSLETGSWSYFDPARALYRKHGFVECEPFADYVPDPNSIFMMLALDA
ncbi:MAG: GNAT family N-acetyltransferase [Rhodospirillales bacterium]|nr:GNAT family N-acetyltransferase [Rhodospirillales bacterium]